MSHVTNIMITGLFYEDKTEAVKNHLRKFTKNNREFMWVDGLKVGGTKNIESDILIGAFDYIDCNLFCEAILGLKNFLDDHIFEKIQIIIKNEHDDYWHIHKASDLNEECFM